MKYMQMISVLMSIFLSATLTRVAVSDELTAGMVGVGTWATQAEFKDIVVTKADQVLFASDFSKGMDGWRTNRGKWEVVDGVLRQTSNEEGTRAIIGEPSWSDYTISLKARKISGNEGFLVLFGLPNDRVKSWWNIGGWGNTQSQIESAGIGEPRVPMKIENGKWYDIKIETAGSTVKVYLDNKLIQSATRSPAQRNFGHPLTPDLNADASISEFDGTFYFYSTTDGAGQGLSTSGLPVVWKSRDFLNWSFSGSIFSENYDAKFWAPSAAIEKDGKYYLFPTLDNRITALVADQPEGPFKTLDGKDVNKSSGWKQMDIKVGHPIDAEIFKDDDGSYYMYWSQRFVAKLKSDFSAFDGDPKPIQTKRGAYSEGPIVFKRKGIYYYVYTQGGSEGYQYAYVTSKVSPTGPWDFPQNDIIATSDPKQGIFGPGHGTIVNPKGTDDWYFVYLEYGRSGTNRQTWADKLYFNEDGTIQPVQLTLNGVGAVRNLRHHPDPNLAFGKQATASTTQEEMRIPPINYPSLNRIETFLPANALDESNGSRWMADRNDSAAWYQLDLGKEMEIKRTEIYFVKPTSGHAYKLEYSVDGKDWQAYGGHDDLKIQSPHQDAKTVQARYLKLTILKGTPGLWEFKVF